VKTSRLSWLLALRKPRPIDDCGLSSDRRILQGRRETASGWPLYHLSIQKLEYYSLGSDLKGMGNPTSTKPAAWNGLLVQCQRKGRPCSRYIRMARPETQTGSFLPQPDTSWMSLGRERPRPARRRSCLVQIVMGVLVGKERSAHGICALSSQCGNHGCFYSIQPPRKFGWDIPSSTMPGFGSACGGGYESLIICDVDASLI
jgi:hypothetical protein